MVFKIFGNLDQCREFTWIICDQLESDCLGSWRPIFYDSRYDFIPFLFVYLEFWEENLFQIKYTPLSRFCSLFFLCQLYSDICTIAMDGYGGVFDFWISEKYRLDTSESFLSHFSLLSNWTRYSEVREVIVITGKEVKSYCWS